MTGWSMIPDDVADEFFRVAQNSLIRRMGNVSFVKFTGATTEEASKQNWLNGVNRFLEAFPAGCFRGFATASGDPVLRFAGGLDLRVDIWQLHKRAPSPEYELNVPLNPHYASIVVEAAGTALWGRPWSDAVDAASHSDSVSVVYFAEKQIWIAQARPQPGPWPSFASESEALRAGVALAVGPLGINALWDGWTVSLASTGNSAEKEREAPQ